MLIPSICSGNASNHPHFIEVAMPVNMGWINEKSKQKGRRVMICAAGDGGRQSLVLQRVLIPRNIYEFCE